MSGMGYIEASDGTRHAPIIGTRWFRWRCMCGAKGSKLFSNRVLAFNAWGHHFDRYEAKAFHSRPERSGE